LHLAAVNNFFKYLKISVPYRKVLYSMYKVAVPVKYCLLNKDIVLRLDSSGSLLHPPRGDGQHHLSPALLLSRWAQHGNNAPVNEEGRYGIPIPYFQPVLWINIGFIADPDPALFCQCGSGFGSRSRVWMTKNLENITAAIYLSLGLHKGRPSSRRYLPPSKENI
jgi:hypothetical protein